MAAAETGEFMSISRKDTDRGVFTVQTTDVPNTPRRRITAVRKSPTKMPKLNSSLAPIVEDNEEIRSQIFKTSEADKRIRCDSPYVDKSRKSGTLTHSSGSTSPTVNSNLSSVLDNLREKCDDMFVTKSEPASPTALSRSKSLTSRYRPKDLSLEYGRLRKKYVGNSMTDIESNKVNKSPVLSPNQKLRRRFVSNALNENASDNDKRKKIKVPKDRNNTKAALDARNSILNLKQSQSVEYHQRRETKSKLPDTKSTENKLYFVSFSKDPINNTASSVPDLPSIMDRLASERLDVSHLQTLSRLSMSQADRSPSNGGSRSSRDGRSTPSQTPESIRTHATNDENEDDSKACLKGSDLTSFYHIWLADRKARPFGKKEETKWKMSITRRECACARHNSPRKSFDGRHSILPPITSPDRLSS